MSIYLPYVLPGIFLVLVALIPLLWNRARNRNLDNGTLAEMMAKVAEQAAKNALDVYDMQRRISTMAKDMDALEKKYVALKRQHRKLGEEFGKLGDAMSMAGQERDAYRKQLIENKISPVYVPFVIGKVE